MSSPFAEVAVPVAQFSNSLTYKVPERLDAVCVPGARVEVTVNNRRLIGLVLSRSDETQLEASRIRMVNAVLDDATVVTSGQLALVHFISQYYFSPIGMVARLVMPPDTQSKIKKTYSIQQQSALVFGAAHGVSADEIRVLESFEENERKTETQLKKLGLKQSNLKKLVDNEILTVHEQAPAGATRKLERLIVLENGEPISNRAHALSALDVWLRQQVRPPTFLESQTLFPGLRGKVRKLIELGRLRIEEETRPVHILEGFKEETTLKELTAHQAEAIEEILAGGPDAYLLEGVTGSGKTEVYLRVLREVLNAGKSALFIVPEIALTPQLFARIQSHVEEEIVLLHSGISLADRRDAYARLREGRAKVAIGARSALFAPLQNLGLVIVDEEHDGSFKQDETPRYHGRDVALFRAQKEGAICVLGSATPSLESRYNVELKKLTHLQLPIRIGGGGRLPDVEIIDLRVRKQMHEAKARDKAQSEGSAAPILSGPLVEEMQRVLAEKEQVLLFLNRRGYSSVLLCESCGEVKQCVDCSVAMTLHKKAGVLLCHQCDHRESIDIGPCQSCGSGPVQALGIGTERVEAEVKMRFPDARVGRLDRDTVKRKEDMIRVLTQMQAREIDILIGTQMIAKGHDFPGIALVGVVLADIALSMPDFRASERAFSLLTQVSGRAGRGKARGKVLIQTYNPEHPAIHHVNENTPETFFNDELGHRRECRYPPYWRTALLRLEGEDDTAAFASAKRVGDCLRSAAKEIAPEGAFDILGPAPAPIERLRGKWRFHVFLRAKEHAVRHRILASLLGDKSLHDALKTMKTSMILDVDPTHMI